MPDNVLYQGLIKSEEAWRRLHLAVVIVDFRLCDIYEDWPHTRVCFVVVVLDRPNIEA